MRALLCLILLTASAGCASLPEENFSPGGLTPPVVQNEDNGQDKTDETIKGLFEEGVRRINDNPKEALQIFNELSRLAPKSWIPHYNMAVTYIKLREFRKAEIELNRALDTNAPPTTIYNAFGALYQYQDNRQKAVEIYEKSLLYEKTPVALVNLASLYQAAGQAKKVVNCLYELEQLSVQDSAIYYNAGLIWYKMGRYQEADDAIEKALKDANDGDVKPLYLKSQILLIQGKYDKAVKVMQQVYAINGLDPTPYMEIGIIYELYVGDMEKALENYRSYVSKNGKKAKEVAGWIEVIKSRQTQNGRTGGS